MIINWYRELFLFLWKYLGVFGGLVGISVVVSLVCLPLYHVIGRIVGMENDLQSVLDPAVARLKASYSDPAKRQAAIERLYARFGYHPIMGVRKVLPLFVAIPFLLLTYHMLSGTSELAGVKWLCFSDLSKPDGMLFGFNLLPFVMTAVNIFTVYATPCFNKKDEVQAWVIAIFFLVLLYSANTALMIYWTLNQLFNFGRTLCEDHFSGLKLLASRLAAVPRGIKSSIVHPFSNTILSISYTWRTPLLVLRNYVLLLLCAFLPALFLIFGHMPDRLDVGIESNRPLSMTTGFLAKNSAGESVLAGAIVQGCPLGHHDDPVSFFLTDGCDTDTLRIKLTASDYDYTVSSLSLVRHLLFKYELPYIVEENTIRCSASPVFAGITFPVVKGSLLALKAGLLGLFILSFFGLFAKREYTTFLDWKLSIALAAIGAAFFTVLLPLQTIFANRDVFDYGFAAIAGQFGLVAIIACSAFFVILTMASISFGRWPHLIFLGFLLYEYLQTGLLSIGAPRMDGNMNYYWERKPLLMDCAVIAFLGIVFLWKSRWIRSHFRKLCWWCVFGIVVMAFVSTFDYIKKETSKSTPPTPQSLANTCPWTFQRSQLAKGLKYSPAGNIIVLVLDSTQSDAAYNAAQIDASLRSAFDGFTAFNNHVGMHDNTYTGSIGLFTGEFTETVQSCWGPKSFVTPYVEADNPVYILPGNLETGFSNRVENRKVEQLSLDSDSVFLCRKRPMNTSLLDVLQLKLVPFFLKKWDLQVMYLGSLISDGTLEEHSLYPDLACCPMGNEAKPALIYLHTEGTHAPIRYDEFGNRLWSDKDNYKGLCGETHYILKSVAAYLNDLKRLGVYDRAMIIVTADHGCCFATPQLPKLKDLPTRAVPMLWIKPIGAKGDLSTTEIPTSHCKIAELMRRARTETITLSLAESIMKAGLRRFYADYDGFTEWLIDADGKRVTK